MVPLRSLLYRMQEEDVHVGEMIDSLTAKIIENQKCFFSNIESFISYEKDSHKHYEIKTESLKLIDECTKLKELQRKIRDNILIVSRMIEGNQISYDNFPVFQDIELAERLAECGRVEEEKQNVAVSL